MTESGNIADAAGGRLGRGPGKTLALIVAASAGLALGSASGAFAAAIAGTDRGELLIGTRYEVSVRDKGGGTLYAASPETIRSAVVTVATGITAAPETTTSTRRTAIPALARHTT